MLCTTIEIIVPDCLCFYKNDVTMLNYSISTGFTAASYKKNV